MEPLEDEFGDIIQKARTGLGLTIRQAADMSGLAVSVLEDMESYGYRPSEEESGTIAAVLGLDPEKLYGIASGKWYPRVYSQELVSDVIVVSGSIGSYKVNGYFLYDSVAREAALFDTANDSRTVLRYLKDIGSELRYIFLTHCHSDHIGGLREIFHSSGAKICIPYGEASEGLTDDMKKNGCIVKDGMDFKTGRYSIKAVSTPGHTGGSTCYTTRDYCFSGDTLFAGSIGRPFSCDGYSTLLKKVREKILSLNEGVRIFPGHGPATTVAEESEHNPFF
ncbi:MAG: MBL fold metallo-hydrolase [Nitrospirae bacterium]|nr:MBL fold metallo-hydrolase [Nitrospirota bacterium]